MTDQYLLVPSHIDAMVLNQEASTATPFLRFQMEYENLKSFENPEPKPFGGASPRQPGAGIYLHWSIPQALRHGIYSPTSDADQSDTDFPLVPNRWLIIRTQAGCQPDQAVKVWVLESDYLDEIDGSNPFVNPHTLGKDGTPTPTKIGRVFRFTPEVKNLPSQPKPFLTAAGPGSVTFTHFSPGVDNVFSFYDDVLSNDDQTPINNGEFSYSVIGWYSDPDRDDPLKNTTWSLNTDPEYPGTYANDHFNWIVYSDTDDLPEKTLIHSLVSGVPWDRDGDNPPPDNFPTDIQENVKVAFGNNAIDALAAIVLLEGSNPTEADLLEAFHYNLLDKFDQPGSSEALNMSTRDHWFGSSPGGTLWRIVAAKRGDNPSLPLPPQPEITPEQKKALADLNTSQDDLDRQQRILSEMQGKLFDLWWKKNWQKCNEEKMRIPDKLNDYLKVQLPLQIGEGSTCSDPTGTDPNDESWYICKVNAQQRKVDQLSDQVSAGVTKVKQLLDEKQELKATNKPEFNYPNDPVMLVTGLGRSTNYDPEESLVCRTLSQLVSKLNVDGIDYCIDTSCPHNIKTDIPILDDPNHLLPDGVQQMSIENFFLSPDMFAQNILGDKSLSEKVIDAYKTISTPSADTQFTPVPRSMEAWIQPWIPLLLDWQVTVLKQPAYTCEEEGAAPIFNRQYWDFDGTDYQWIGPTEATDEDFDESDSGQMQLTGRTFITPQTSMTLAKQLDQYVKKHKMRDPNLEKLLEDLDKYLDDLAGHDILSQRLSGMTGMMIEKIMTQNVAPSGDIADSLQDCNSGYPMPFPGSHASFAEAVWDFAPMRGSFFVINKLSVIDNFGRTIDLMLGNYSTCPQTEGDSLENYFYPYAGRNLKAPTAKDPKPGQPKSANPTDRMLQLPPRNILDSRLNFDMTPADPKKKDATESDSTNPVCGWIVPNHLDRSLSLYAADGTAWGELYLSLHDEKKYIPVWQPDPTNPDAPKQIGDIPNDFIKSILQVLNDRTDNGQGFYDFMQVIDETLWTVNPRGWRDDRNLSILIGRPLAVVRAEISLAMKGLPYTNQDWWHIFDIDAAYPPNPKLPAALKQVDGGIFDHLWPVRLGSQVLSNDGLVGYYLDNPKDPSKTFTTFNSVCLPEGMETDYIQQIGKDNYLNLKFIDDTVTSPDPLKNQTCSITMLVDPRGSIHAFTGLLPVTSIDVPSEIMSAAFDKMSYTFRAGPFLTAPEAIRIPKPAEQKGIWQWFDKVLNTTTTFVSTDGKARFPTTPSLVKEGWMAFKPNEKEEG